MIDRTIGKTRGFIDINIPLDHSARLRFFTRGYYQLAFSIDGAAVSNSICGYENKFGSQYISRLSQGVVISNCAFYPQYGTFLIMAPYSGGPFFERGIGFMGFRFNNGAGMQYGWVRVKMKGPPYFDLRFRLEDYAWGDPGDQVKTGETSLAGDQVEAIPDQGSLGLLALGGAGLMVWRKRRRSSAGSQLVLPDRRPYLQNAVGEPIANFPSGRLDLDTGSRCSVRSHRQNKSFHVSNSRWLAYATALGNATPTEAEIHYSGVLDIKFKRAVEDEAHKLRLSGGAFLGFARLIGGSYYVAGVGGVLGAAVSNAVRSGSFLARLERGVNVSSDNFYDLGELGELFGIYNSGNFASPGEGFLGFRFDNGQGMQYGWARLEWGNIQSIILRSLTMLGAIPGIA